MNRKNKLKITKTIVSNIKNLNVKKLMIGKNKHQINDIIIERIY